MNKEKIKQNLVFEEYLKEKRKLGEAGTEEMEELKEIFHELLQKGEDWREYATYKRLDVHPDPIAAKKGRSI